MEHPSTTKEVRELSKQGDKFRDQQQQVETDPLADEGDYQSRETSFETCTSRSWRIL